MDSLSLTGKVYAWPVVLLASVLVLGGVGVVSCARSVEPWQTGSRDCNTMWADVQGSVIKETSESSPGSCCSRCKSESGCNAWSFCTADMCGQAPAGLCMLKSIPDIANPNIMSMGKSSSFPLISGIITERTSISRGNLFVDRQGASFDPSFCPSTCSAYSDGDCWVVAPTDNVLSEPQEAGVLKYMRSGRFYDLRTSQEPERSSIIDFVVTADMRLAVAVLGEVLPIIICGRDMCEKYCNARAHPWIPSEKEAFQRCLGLDGTRLQSPQSVTEASLTLEACMVQQQVIVGGHLAPRPFWCQFLDPPAPYWQCDGQDSPLGQGIAQGATCSLVEGDISSTSCSDMYGEKQISGLCCLRDL